MAITGTLAVSTTCPNPNQQFQVTLTLSNSGASAVTVLGVKPRVYPNNGTDRSSSTAVGIPPIAPGMSVSIPASGNLVLAWTDVVLKPPPVDTSDAPGEYFAVDCVVDCSDGTTVIPTASVISCSTLRGAAMPEASYSPSADFSVFYNSGYVPVVFPGW